MLNNNLKKTLAYDISEIFNEVRKSNFKNETLKNALCDVAIMYSEINATLEYQEVSKSELLEMLDSLEKYIDVAIDIIGDKDGYDIIVFALKDMKINIFENER